MVVLGGVAGASTEALVETERWLDLDSSQDAPEDTGTEEPHSPEPSFSCEETKLWSFKALVPWYPVPDTHANEELRFPQADLLGSFAAPAAANPNPALTSCARITISIATQTSQTPQKMQNSKPQTQKIGQICTNLLDCRLSEENYAPTETTRLGHAVEIAAN